MLSARAFLAVGLPEASEEGAARARQHLFIEGNSPKKPDIWEPLAADVTSAWGECGAGRRI